jgi:hypothetical protein
MERAEAVIPFWDVLAAAVFVAACVAQNACAECVPIAPINLEKAAINTRLKQAKNRMYMYEIIKNHLFTNCFCRERMRLSFHI